MNDGSAHESRSMVNVTFGEHSGPDLPYTLLLHGVSEELFDEFADAETRAELIDGVMFVRSPASLEHDDVAGFLRALLRCLASARSAGDVLGPDSLVRLRPGRSVAPDIFFLRAGRLPVPRPRLFDGTPDWVIEVLSPSNGPHDLGEKRAAYREARVREIWMIDPRARTVAIDRLAGGSYAEIVVSSGRIFSSVLEGFFVEAEWLWQPQLPDLMTCLQLLLGPQS